MKTLLFRSLFVSLFLGGIVLQPVHSSDKKVTKEPLSGSLQFQFLIGDWDIKAKRYYVPAGGLKEEKTAWQHVEYRDNGNMIVEEFITYNAKNKEKEAYGITLRTYSEETQQWQNVYFQSNQAVGTSSFVSEWKNNEMHGRGQYEVEGLGTIQYKLRFYNITQNSFEWEQELSKDGGKNWFLELRQRAIRRSEK